MLNRIDGLCYKNLIYSGLKNLEKHRSMLNDLNVFPVPDGDTGTNMVMTVRNGYESIKNKTGTLSELSGSFSSAAVFGARGNSGVIVSQFFKGVSEGFVAVDSADSELLAAALQKGCEFAYASVSKPAEGTMLTVLKDASNALNAALPLESLGDAIDILLQSAKASLANTPELLPILKKAGVVDSGGSGIVYFFEGIRKYIYGESIEAVQDDSASDAPDLTIFNKDTVFSYGYCVEGLIQLKTDVRDFDHAAFKEKLEACGESVVLSVEADKVKIHVHVHDLSVLMLLCQGIGEFLTVKIDNMTVQNMQKAPKTVPQRKFLYNTSSQPSDYAVVAVATNTHLQQMFFDMGADVVVLSEIAPSLQDFLDAFRLTGAKDILVFPNSANSICVSNQAAELYTEANVATLNSRSAADCYAVLSVLDFDSTPGEALDFAEHTLATVEQFSIHHAVKDVTFDDQVISKSDFFALKHKAVLGVSSRLEELVVQTIRRVLDENAFDVVTLFYGKYISQEYIEHLAELVREDGYEIETATVSTLETLYDITVTFE